MPSWSFSMMDRARHVNISNLWPSARPLLTRVKIMTLFLITFAFIAVVIAIMSVGVIFGRQAIKGSCGGSGGAECVCTEKCDKRKQLEAAQSLK